MLYYVTGSKELFETDLYKIISVEESLEMLRKADILQYDSETHGKDPHIGFMYTIQFGSKVHDFQIVIDVTTVSPVLYKEILETKFLIMQNGKFDIQWLFNYEIIPRKVYDTMVVEQFLHLGYPSVSEGGPSMSLAAIANRRLGVDLDKTVRGQIYYLGLCPKVIKYAGDDVVYLEDIMWSQMKDLEQRGGLLGAKIECDFVVVVAYLEWCGIKLDVNKWKAKMDRDSKNLETAKTNIDQFVIDIAKKDRRFKKYIEDASESLFGDEFGDRCLIDWNSNKQVVPFVKDLGFKTQVKDKKTGEDKDTALEKELTRQKGINDEFLKLMFGKDYIDENGEEQHYWGYKECFKLCSTYGQGHLNAINPNTGRLHTNYRSIGTVSGRMSSGSKEKNTDLAKLKGLPEKEVPYPNMQQLPKDHVTRSCFVSEPGNLFCSCDYSAIVTFPINVDIIV